jgi:uncharacterized protein (TIGR00251 family)
MLCYEKSKNGTYLKVKVVPKSSRNEIKGLIGDRIKITVTAAPQKGKANETVEELIAQLLDVERKLCCVSAGHQNPQKTVFVAADIGGKVQDLLLKWQEDQCS